MPTTATKSDVRKIPKLRFPGFSGDWEEKKLGEVFEEITDSVGNRDIETYSITAGKGFVSQKEKFGKNISGKQGSKYTVLAPYEFTYNKGNSKTYKYGCVYINLESKQIAVPNVFISFRALDEKNDPLFFAKLFESHYLDSGLRKIISSTSRADGLLNVNKNNFFKIKIFTPKPKEQQEISDFLSSTDKWIETLRSQKEALESYKAGMLRKIFSQELRFKDDEGKGFSEWEEKELGMVANFRRGSFPQPYGLAKWYDDESGFPFVQVFDVDDNLKLKNYTQRRITEAAKRLSVFVEKGTIVLTIQGSIGRIALTQYDACVDRTLLIFQSFKKPFDKTFFIYMIFLLFEIEKMKAPGGTIKTITKEALSRFRIYFPNLSEQQKIADFLSSIDKLIESKQQQITLAGKWKKGLMQNLFV